MNRDRSGLSGFAAIRKAGRRGLAWIAAATVLAAWAVAELLTSPVDRSAYNVRFSPDGARVAAACVAGGVGRLAIWDGRTGQPLGSSGVEGLPLGLAFSPDSRTIAVGTWPGTVSLHDSADGRPIRTLAGFSTPIRGLDFTPDGRTLVAGASEGTIIAWDVETGRVRLRFDRGTNLPVNSLAISGDGRFAAAAGGWKPGSTTLHDLTTGQTVARSSLANLAEPVAFAPGTSTLAGASAGGIQLADDTASPSAAIPARPLSLMADGRPVSVRALAFSADGRRLATGGDDELVRVWDVASGRLVASMDQHRQPPDLLSDNLRGLLHTFTSGHVPLRSLNTVWSVSFSPDGTRLASGSQDGSVWVRPLPGIAPYGPTDLVLVPAPGRPGWWMVLRGVAGLGVLALVALGLRFRPRSAMARPPIPADSG